MRDSRGAKLGALTPEQCFLRASELIAEHGVCLFIVDLVGSKLMDSAEKQLQYALLEDFQLRAHELFADSMPEHSLVTFGLSERGFRGVLGDSALVGIDDPKMTVELIGLRERDFPELKLHYGVAADAWSEGIELIK